MPRISIVAAAVFLVTIVAACATQGASQVVVSYASTPAPPLLAAAPATPTPGRRRRPTRIPADLPALAPTLIRSAATSVPSDTQATIPTPSVGVAASPLVTPDQAGAPADDAGSGLQTSTNPSPAAEAVSPSPAVEAAIPSPTEGIASTPPTVVSVPPSATPMSSPAAAAMGISGQVPESEGQFVTSSSKTSRYYYARADTGWRRIHPDHRIWFLTAEALLRAFPGRVLHGSATPTPGSRATATPTS